MFRPIRLIPAGTNFPFIRHHRWAFAFSGALMVASLVALLTLGLNFGIDFRGGLLIEVKTQGPADVQGMRSKLSELDLGSVALQEFGAPDLVMIRIQRQGEAETDQAKAVEAVKATLCDKVEYRRTEFVGPTVGAELIEAGLWATFGALASILVYVWFRFEWQFGVAALVALFHDMFTTLGLFALNQHEFNLPTVAAVLTIAGYSINDTVVVFDRVRENFRKYKKMPLPELFNLSINETLSRTTMTSFTTLLALIAIFFFGGPVLSDFALALIWGITIGTYSTIFVALALMLYLKPGRGEDEAEGIGVSVPQYERAGEVEPKG